MKVKFNSPHMKGDILNKDDNHRKAANQIVDLILKDIQKANSKFVITVAGESGAGKSEIASFIADTFKKHKIKSCIFGQDDYFYLPPKTNSRQREKDISWVGMQEVNLELLNQNILDFVKGNTTIIKPLVDFNADKIEEETANLERITVLIVEGTYTTSLNNINCKIFIDRNKMDTIESRGKRAREKQDNFLDKILTIEHEIISKHKDLADIVISKEWNAFKIK
jgi:uridine kinase